MFVKNWTQVYKSLAVWLPVIVLGLIEMLNQAKNMELIPTEYLFLVAGVSAVLGWVINQDKTPMKIKNK